jgi:hypothetical protein
MENLSLMEEDHNMKGFKAAEMLKERECYQGFFVHIHGNVVLKLGR